MPRSMRRGKLRDSTTILQNRSTAKMIRDSQIPVDPPGDSFVADWQKMNRQGPVSARRNSGQAMLLVVLLLPAVLIAGFMVYSAAQLTSAKMEVQNAADAAAYSVSTLEARDLNFMAYTNRAMVANDVGIAQIVGLASWAGSLRSVNGQLGVVEQNACPRLGAIGGTICSVLLNVLKAYYGGLGTGFERAITAVGRPVIRGLDAVNHNLYGNAQQIYHGVTVYLVGSALLGGGASGAATAFTPGDEPMVLAAIEENAPGARLSPWGTFALAGHILYYAGDFFPSLLARIDQESFLSTYDPGESDDSDGFEAFAAIQRDSRDRFLRSRGNDDPNDPFRNPAACPFPPPADVIPCGSISESVTIGLPGFSVEVTLNIALDFGLEFGLGGNELRYGADRSGQNFNHQAIDKSRAFINAGVTADIDIPSPFDILICPLIPFGPPGFFQDDGGDCTVNILGAIEEEFFIAFGFAQSGGGGTITRRAIFGTDIDDDAFNAGNGSGAFFGDDDNLPISGIGVDRPPRNPFVPSLGSRTTTLGQYSGLPKYTDTTEAEPPESLLGFKAPFFLVGVVQSVNPDQSGLFGGAAEAFGSVGEPEYVNDEGTVTPTGQLELIDRGPNGSSEGAANRVAAIAKSEVYFSRPSDVLFFARPDGNTEYGSAFNPFWQARLVDTNALDRSVSLTMQQGLPWFSQVTGIAQNLVTAIGNFGVI